MWQAENFDQANWIGVVALDLKETSSQLLTILNSISHQHLKHTDQKDTGGIPSLKAYLNIDWKQFDNQNHRVPILNIGVTKANVKIVKVGSIRQLFIQRSENY